ncbi:hypothetical protein [Rhodopirellula sp. MGV]|uniref:hypothetical protein n=1 Tax=Rhodopirellula sp. MGV TaxID=2023130 RepID=UPI000B971660|nr:hypothetical protein [Rhodopirellula sp. MGV]OYP31140.1 hypothetical protein CGZ80_21355 [Rhodopirellula sp. MGV]PNY36037.1 hypothetical protein C2E31_15070 [Rhodopirellula baltica]
MSRENKRNQMRKFNQRKGEFQEPGSWGEHDRYRDRDYPRQKNWSSFCQQDDDDQGSSSWDFKESGDENEEQAA